MTIKTIDLATVNAQDVLDLILFLTPADRHWLTEQLQRLDAAKPLPQQATLEEAIQLYLADSCSLAKAADLAGITRWELQDILYERGTSVEIYCPDSAEEMDVIAAEMEREGLLR
jgi:predicted HTH domain antitoxin